MIPMDIIVFVVSLLTGLHFTTGVINQRFVNNTLQVDWSGDGDSYDISVSCTDNPVRNNRFLNSPCTNLLAKTAKSFTCRVESTSFTVQNPLDCQSYQIIVDDLTGRSIPREKTSFQTPPVIYTTVGSSVNLSWSSPGVTSFGYNIKNMDNDHLYIQLSESNKDVKDNSTDFLGDPANLTNVTRMRIKNTSLTHGGYIVSGFVPTVYGGIILAVQGKPSKPKIISSTTEVKQGGWIPLTCESIPNTKPDYVDFPQIAYTWYVNGTVKKLNNYQASRESLTITSVTRSDSYNIISCRATQNTTVSEFSDITKLNVLYGPREVVLSPNNSTTNLDEGQNLGPISCSADCNPICTILWRFNATVGDGRFVDKTTQHGMLHIVNVRRSMAGVYRCLVKNKVGSNRKDVFLNVLFPPDRPTVRIRGQEIIDGNTEVRNESSELVIRCESSSYPTSSLSLRRERKELYNGTSNSIAFPLTNVSCTDSGQYTCLAINNIGRNQSSFNLQIQCKPQVKQTFKSQFGAEINSTLPISIPVIANPKPSLSWTSNNGLRTTVQNASRMSLSYDYLITTNLTIMSKEQYGNYTVTITNGLGRISHAINIIPKGKPLPVQSFSHADVDSSSVNLTWIPGFNGGATQHFVISHDSPKTLEWIVVLNETDPGRTQLISRLIQGLMPNRRYRFRIVSANRFGDTSQMPLYVDFTTKGLPESDPLVSGSMVGVAAGVSALIVVVIIGIVVFLAVKKLRKTEAEKGEKTRYGPTIGDASEQPRHGYDDDNMYANSPNSQNDNTLQVRYATPSEPTKESTRTQNQDGLIYIDVDFEKPNESKMGRPVIHGDDSRTNYMQVDFTNNYTDSEAAE